MTTEHFTIDAGGRTVPQDWLQQRLVASAQSLSVDRSYSPTGGGNKNDLLQALSLRWTNTTPIPQLLFGMVTRGGAVVALQARSRGFLSMWHGYEITPTPTPVPDPDDYAMIEVSRFGVGADVGRGGLLAAGTGFCIAEKRQNSTSAPFMPHSPGLIRVAPGETIHAQVNLYFRTEFWENTSIDGGSSGTSSTLISGDTRLDLWAYPAIDDPGPRDIPTVVDAKWARTITSDISVPRPTGLAAGDVVLALMFNQWDGIDDFYPSQSGWSQLDVLTAGANDVHFRLLWRVAGVSEPTSYTFENGLLAEGTVAVIAIRNASTFLEEWYAASVLRRFFWERDDGHICPSIDRKGQLLLCFSGFAHATSQSPITQQAPTGMTPLLNLPGQASSVAVATLPSPPRPTGNRMFVPSKIPVWSGRSITLSLLIPGDRS